MTKLNENSLFVQMANNNDYNFMEYSFFLLTFLRAAPRINHVISLYTKA